MPANIVAVGDEDCCDAGLGVGVAPEDARPRGEGEGFGVSEAEACGAERSGAGEDRSTAFETYKKGEGRLTGVHRSPANQFRKYRMLAH